MFRGSIVALITPMRQGAIDDIALSRLIEWHLSEGTHGIVPVGTTGESPTLSHDEHEHVIAQTIEIVAGRAPVIAGTGSNATDEAISLTLASQKAGADAALIVTPYYNKPTQDGLFAHYQAIHDATELPIIIYNVPGRTSVDIGVETVARLADLPRIVGIKDASADIVRPLATLAACGPEFCQLSGEDANIVGFLAHGGHGCISVTANVAPRMCSELHNAWQAGDAARALEIHARLYPLHDALFAETSPSPCKYAVHRLGHCEEDIRLPLVPIKEQTRMRVDAAMRSAGLLN